MTDVSFYHLTRKTLEQALPELLEKTLERKKRAVVMTGSNERAESLTQYLWTYKPDGFLPHGNAKDGYANQQPIWITAEDERPNEAAYLFLTDGAQSAHIETYERVFDLFNGNDEAAVAAARIRWKESEKAGHTLSYWKQTETGWIDATPPRS
ncbi:MAG: DNA polymerase III subunit chi [Alphaproteobacteria bacterium]|nr:DNA polymerase III subunit chi [Alphaproteobacteria bacterium]